MSRKLVSFDWAIKRILRSKANFAVLEGFLSELLYDDIRILEVLESESNQDHHVDKFNRLDIKVKNSHQEIILIEIQYSSEMDYLQRILYATSKAVTEHLKQGEAYAKVSKIISVNILYFDFGDGDDYLYHGTTQFIGMNKHTPLRLNAKQRERFQSDQVKKLYPEYYLIKVKNFNDHAKTRLDEWIYFLKNEEIKETFHAKGLKQAKETLNYLKMSDPERLRYQHHQEELHHRASLYESTFVTGKIEGLKEGREEGLEQGLQKGLEQGRQKGQEEGRETGILTTAKNMKSAGIAIEMIQQVTDLSLEQIQSL